MKMTLRQRIGARLLGETLREFLNTSVSGNASLLSTITGGARGGVQLTDPYSQHPVVYACVKLLADNVAQVPFEIMTASAGGGGKGTRAEFNRRRFVRHGTNPSTPIPNERAEGFEVVDNGPLVELFNRPNPLQSGNQFWSAVATFLTYSGECDVYAAERADVTKIPTNLVPADPAYFMPKPDAALVPLYWQFRGPTGQSKRLAPYELIRPRLFNPKDMRRGLSPLQVAALGLAMDWNARLYNKAFFENDATPGGFLFAERPMKKPQRDEWMRGWYQTHGGADNAFKWALLEGIKDVKPTTMAPKDAQFMELMSMSKEEIAMIWRIPMVFLSRTNEINYATDKAERKGFWSTTLIPILRHLEDIFNAELFQYVEGGRYWGAFDLSSIDDLQEDIAARLEQAVSLYAMRVPFNVINERLALGFEPIVGGDTVLVPSTEIPLEMAVAGAALDLKTEASPRVDDTGRQREDAPPWQAFDDVREPQVRSWWKAYRKYLREYRKYVLDQVDRQLRAEWTDIYLGAQDEWDARLVAATSEEYVFAVGAASTTTATELGVAPFLTATNPESIKIMERRRKLLVGTNATMRDNMRRSIAEGLTNGETAGQIKTRVKKVMNFQDSRSLTIARTEVGSVMSDARFGEMRAAGVTHASWTTAADATVRESHLAAARVGAQTLGSTFAMTGCRYPLDPRGKASEVINCRCVLVPETRGGL